MKGSSSASRSGPGDLGPDPCDDCGLGVGGDFHIGAMASRKVAVMLEGSFVDARQPDPRPLRRGRAVLARSRRPLLAQGRDRRRLPRPRRLVLGGLRSTTTATTTSIRPCSGPRASKSCAPDASRSTSSCAARPRSRAATPPTASPSTSGRTGTEPSVVSPLVFRLVRSSSGRGSGGVERDPARERPAVGGPVDADVLDPALHAEGVEAAVIVVGRAVAPVGGHVEEVRALDQTQVLQDERDLARRPPRAAA